MEGAEYREHHRQRYVAYLERVINAFRQPESVRLANAELLSRLVWKATIHRVRAVSGFMALDDSARMFADDPLVCWCDEHFGNIEDVALSCVAFGGDG